MQADSERQRKIKCNVDKHHLKWNAYVSEYVLPSIMQIGVS